MYLLLLVFGGLLGAAGVILAGSGMSLRDGTFDAAIVTPGIVAAAGGLLLIDAPNYAPLLPFVITIVVVAMTVKTFGYRDNSHVLP